MDKRCPRCKRYLPVEVFQEPVRICLVCYSRIPENDGLSIGQLREKAAHSRWARANLNKSSWQERFKSLSSMTTRDPKIIESILSEYGEVSIECHMCHQQTHHITTLNYHGVEQDVCPGCYLLIHPERKGMFTLKEFEEESEEFKQLMDGPTRPKIDIKNISTDVLNIAAKKNH